MPKRPTTCGRVNGRVRVVRSRFCLFLAVALVGAILCVLYIWMMAPQQNEMMAPQAEEAEKDLNFDIAARRIQAELAENTQTSGEQYLHTARLSRRGDLLEQAEKFLEAAEKKGADHDAVVLERRFLRAQFGYARQTEPALHEEIVGDRAELALEALTRGYLRAYRFQDGRRCAQL